MAYFNQEKIVLLISALVALVFAIAVPEFLTWGNFTAFARSITVLGVFGLGMAVVVIGRGVDLSQAALALIAIGIAVELMHSGVTTPPALLIGLMAAVCMGAINGVVIAWLHVPPLFATLASAVLFTGLGRVTMLESMIIHLPRQNQGILLLDEVFMGVPVSLMIFALCALITHVFLSSTVAGKYIYALGCNPAAARLTGLPVKGIVMLKYILSASIGYIGGLIMVASTAMVNLKSAGTFLIFDILMVVIIGGVTLCGGRGSVLSVLAGTLLIGLLFNGMTLLDLDYQFQNIIKGMVLLLAVTLDGWLMKNRREQIQQGI